VSDTKPTVARPHVARGQVRDRGAPAVHVTRGQQRAGADLDLPQDRVSPRGEPHVARQRQFAVRPAGPAVRP